MTEKEIKGRQLLELTEKFFEHSDNVIFVQQISGMNEVMIKGDTRKTLNMAFTLCETLIKKTGIKIDYIYSLVNIVLFNLTVYFVGTTYISYIYIWL